MWLIKTIIFVLYLNHFYMVLFHLFLQIKSKPGIQIKHLTTLLFFQSFINLKLGFFCLIPRKHKWVFLVSKNLKLNTKDRAFYTLLLSKYITDTSCKTSIYRFHLLLTTKIIKHTWTNTQATYKTIKINDTQWANDAFHLEISSPPIPPHFNVKFFLSK